MATTDQVNFRLPHDCRQFLAEQAKADASSKTSVIIRAIRAMMAQKAERPAAPTAERS